MYAGSYSQCRNCRMPLSATDTDPSPDNTSYIEGIHCKHCVNSLTDKKKASLAERNRQIKLANDNNTSHLGLQEKEIKKTRSLKISKRTKKKQKTSLTSSPCDPPSLQSQSQSSQYSVGSLIVITRVHCKQSSSTFVNIEKIIHFIQHCDSFADKILILLGINYNSIEHRKYLDELLSTLKISSTTTSPSTTTGMDLYNKVQIEVVTPWVGFTTPLNVGIRLAIDAGYDHVMFQVCVH